jgi:hypothetical protein
MSIKNPDQYLNFNFEQIPLIESGTSEIMSVNGEDFPFLVNSPMGRGLKLSSGYYCSYGLNARYNNFRNNVSFGFWLYSNSIKNVDINGTSYEPKIPVFDISNSYVSGNNFIFNGGLVIVYEKCIFTDYNQLNIIVIGSDGVKYSFESEVYLTGIFNHFIISINMEINEIKMFINGVETILTALGPGLPTYIGTNGSFDLNINKNINGSINGYIKNEGIVDDFFIIDEYIIENYLIRKIISNGFMNSLNDITASFNEFKFEASISFVQDFVIQPNLTSVDPFNADIVGGTQDGYLLRGQNAFWNKTYNFASVSSLEEIKIKYISIDDDPTGFASDPNDGKIVPGKGIFLNKHGIVISE